MATLISSWSKGVQALPEAYVLPPGRRPGDVTVPSSYDNPVVDLNKTVGNDRAETVQQIVKACQEFGFFQVINHGISGGLMDDTMNLAREFFDMPGEVKSSVFTADSSKSCKLYTSTFNYDKEKIHFWRDTLTHPCHPVEDCMHLWPQKPTRYREVVGKYSVEVRKMTFRILDLISEGLGLEQGYFGGEVSKVQLLSVNHYPRCPNPSLALGVDRHPDPNLITILDQGGVYGLQVFKDGQWIGVEPIPNAFVVIVACQLQIISNDKLRAAEHRVVTNSKEARTSVGYFVIPSYDYTVEPAKALINQGSSAQSYRAFPYKDFIRAFTAINSSPEAIMESYKFRA